MTGASWKPKYHSPDGAGGRTSFAAGIRAGCYSGAEEGSCSCCWWAWEGLRCPAYAACEGGYCTWTAWRDFEVGEEAVCAVGGDRSEVGEARLLLATDDS